MAPDPRAGDADGNLLIALLAVIGIGSGLFHTLATGWAALADVVPIALFILAYLFAANRTIWGWPLWAAALGAVAFLPYAAGADAALSVAAVLRDLGLLLAGAAPDRRHCAVSCAAAPPTPHGASAVGAGLLTLSLTLPLARRPALRGTALGTHFLWHLLNGAMLGWMIEVYRRHVLEDRAAGR